MQADKDPNNNAPYNPGWYYDDIIIGRTYEFGAARLEAEDIALFHEKFAPHLPLKPAAVGDEGKGPRAAESHVYALWRRMLFDETRNWPIIQRMGQDALRFYRAVYAGDDLSVRLSFLATEDRTDKEGVLIANHDVIDANGLLVMSVMTRSLLAKRPAAINPSPNP